MSCKRKTLVDMKKRIDDIDYIPLSFHQKVLCRLFKRDERYRTALTYIVDHKWSVTDKDGEPTFTQSRQKWINEIMEVAETALAYKRRNKMKIEIKR